MKSWTERVVDELVALRANGVENFERAWTQALLAHPPRQIEQGPAVQSLLDMEESLVDFLHRRARLEWEGRVDVDFRAGLMLLASSAAVTRSRVVQGHSLMRS